MTGLWKAWKTYRESEAGREDNERFPPLPTAPWKSLRDYHISTAPTNTILSYEPGDISIALLPGTFLLPLDTHQPRAGLGAPRLIAWGAPVPCHFQMRTSEWGGAQMARKSMSLDSMFSLAGKKALEWTPEARPRNKGRVAVE